MKLWIVAAAIAALSLGGCQKTGEAPPSSMGGFHSKGRYFGVGLYAAQIERFTRRFPKDQIHVVFFNELNKRPAETTRSAFEFLGVDPGFVPDFKVHSHTAIPATT